MTIFGIMLLLTVILFRGDLVALAARYFIYKKTNRKKNESIGLKLYKIAVTIGGCSRTNKITYGYFALRAGQLDTAEKIVSKQLEKVKAPDQIVSAKSTLALVYWKKNDLDKAIDYLEDVLEMGENTTAYGSLGHMYNQRDFDLQGTLEFCKKAYEYNPDDSIITDNYGTILYRTGDVKAAKELYKKLIASEPTFPEAYYTYAHILIDEGRLKDAVKMLKKALSANYTFLTTLKKEDVENEIKEYSLKIYA